VIADQLMRKLWFFHLERFSEQLVCDDLRESVPMANVVVKSGDELLVVIFCLDMVA